MFAFFLEISEFFIKFLVILMLLKITPNLRAFLCSKISFRPSKIGPQTFGGPSTEKSSTNYWIHIYVDLKENVKFLNFTILNFSAIVKKFCGDISLPSVWLKLTNFLFCHSKMQFCPGNFSPCL